MGLRALSWGQPASSLPPPPPSVAGDQGPMERPHGHSPSHRGTRALAQRERGLALPPAPAAEPCFPPPPGHLLFRSIYLPASSMRAALDTGVRLVRGSCFPGCKWGLRGGGRGSPLLRASPPGGALLPAGCCDASADRVSPGPGVPVPLPARPHPRMSPGGSADTWGLSWGWTLEASRRVSGRRLRQEFAQG